MRPSRYYNWLDKDHQAFDAETLLSNHALNACIAADWRFDRSDVSQYSPSATSVWNGRTSRRVCRSCPNMNGGSRATPAPFAATSAVVDYESNIDPLLCGRLRPAAASHCSHSTGQC